MKHVKLVLAGGLGLALVACGGSGGGGTKAAPAGLTSQPRVEAVVLNPTTYDSGVDANGKPYSYAIQDPLDIEANDQVQFQLVNYTTVGTVVTRNVLATTNWSSSDTSNSFGALAYDTGVFQAKGNETTNALNVATFFNGAGFGTQYKVLPHQVRLRGQILSDDTNVPLNGIEIDFYGPQNPNDPNSLTVLVGKVTTAYDGTFRASIPAWASAFQLKNSTLPAGYQRYFRYVGAYYQTGNEGCEAPLPLFTNGERFLIDYTNPDVTQNGTILLLSSTETTPTNAQLSCTSIQ